MASEHTPNAAEDVEMSQYVADRSRVNEDKIKQDDEIISQFGDYNYGCLLYTSPSPRDLSTSRMPSSA